MITLKCTRKLLDLLGGVTIEEAPPPTSALGDWYATVTATVGGELIVFANERTLLSVALPMAMVNALVPAFAARVYNLLVTIGVPEDMARRGSDELREIEFAKTSSRSVLGSLNQIVLHYQLKAERSLGSSPPVVSEAEVALSRTLHGPLDYVYPAEIAKQLLAKRYGQAD